MSHAREVGHQPERKAANGSGWGVADGGTESRSAAAVVLATLVDPIDDLGDPMLDDVLGEVGDGVEERGHGWNSSGCSLIRSQGTAS
jgi:hypothetical protein